MMFFITLLHYYTDFNATALHILYRRLYYIPIIYASFRFGLRGGVATSIAASLLFAPHVALGIATEGAEIDNWLEIILFNGVAIVAGGLVEAERRQMANYNAVSSQLETAYRKLEERALALSSLQNYTKSILESTTSGVLSVDVDMRIVACNKAASEIFGMDEADIIGSRLFELCKGDTDMCQQVQRVVDGERERVDTEMTLTNAQGRIIPATVSVAPHKDLGGGKIGAVVTVEDLTEIRELTEQLLRADRLAAMGELVAGVAHEVRNPLGTIRASMQLIEDEKAQAASVAELAPIVMQEIDRLDRVIRTLLDFGRPSKPVFKKADLKGIIDDVILFVGNYARGARVTISAKTARDVPLVWADGERLKQVFINLIFNAVQSISDGGRVEITAEPDDAFVRVQVRDNGLGIPADALPKIWDPFYTTREDGTGLGLAIVHRIIDEHSGYISVESEAGKGSVFTVRLPIEPRGRTAEVARKPSEEAAEASQSKKSPRET